MSNIATMTLEELQAHYKDATREQLLLAIQLREQALEQSRRMAIAPTHYSAASNCYRLGQRA